MSRWSSRIKKVEKKESQGNETAGNRQKPGENRLNILRNNPMFTGKIILGDKEEY